MEQVNNFSKFGKSFQEDLCHLILNDRTFADQMFEVLDLNFLELKHLRVFTRKVKDYRSKYGVHPTSNIMHSIIRTGLDGEPESVKVRIREYYARVLANGEIPESAEYIKDTALDFCKKQKLKEALIKSVELIKSSSFDEVSKVIDNALKLGSDNTLGYDYIADFEARFVKKARNPITTGWRDLLVLVNQWFWSTSAPKLSRQEKMFFITLLSLQILWWGAVMMLLSLVLS